jgi:hypothetical protein
VLVLVGLLQPLVPLFDYLSRSSLELCRLLCNDQNFPLIWESSIYKLHHALEVWMKEELIYFGAVCWSWMGCYSLWFRYLSRSSLELCRLLCNGQNFPLIGKVAYTSYTIEKWRKEKEERQWSRRGRIIRKESPHSNLGRIEKLADNPISCLVTILV